jgi:hypothetical protein
MLAEGLAELGFTVQPRRHLEQVDRRLRQVGVAAAAQPFVGHRRARAHVDDGLQRAADALAAQQVLELALARHEVLAQAPARRHQHGALVGGGRPPEQGGVFPAAQADAEFGIGEMDDVVVGQQHRTVDALAVDEGAVGAVDVGQAQATGNVGAELGMAPAQAHRPFGQVVGGIAADAKGQLLDLVHHARPVGGQGFEIPGRIHVGHSLRSPRDSVQPDATIGNRAWPHCMRSAGLQNSRPTAGGQQAEQQTARQRHIPLAAAKAEVEIARQAGPGPAAAASAAGR